MLKVISESHNIYVTSSEDRLHSFTDISREVVDDDVRDENIVSFITEARVRSESFLLLCLKHETS